MAKKTPTVESPEAWAARYYTERGFDCEFAKKNDCEQVDDAGAGRRGYAHRGGIIFHSNDPITHQRLTSGPLRHQHPIPYTEKGKAKERKFSQRKDSPYEPYFAPCMDWKRAFKDVKVDMILSEGPTRSLAGAKHDRYVIALPGVNGHGPGDELHASLRRIVWKGRKVYICFDADAESNPDVRHHEQALARKLAKLGAAVYIVRIPRFAPRAGLDDLIGRSGDAGLQLQLDAAQQWGGSDALEIVQLSTVEAKQVRWTWRPYMPAGMLTMLSGDPAAGKTFIALAIAAALSNGKMPYSGEKCDPVTTLYLSVENSAEYVTKPRFDALGGNSKRFHTLKSAVTLSDIAALENAVAAKNAGLLIIDPIQSYLGAAVDAHRANEVRPVMDGLVRLAERHALSVLIIRHLAKSSGGRAIHAGIGSIDFTAAVRSELMAGTAPDEPGNRALVPIKNSVGRHGESLRYDIVGDDMAAKLVWRGISELTSADLRAPEGNRKSETQIDRARKYLLEALANGPKLQSELLEDAEFSERVLQKAGTGLVERRYRGGPHGPREWALLQHKFAKKMGGESE